jgi:hypothetical protein
MKRLLTPYNLIFLALSAVLSVAFGHAADLIVHVIESRPVPTVALVTDVAAVVGCSAAAVGLLRILHDRPC